MTRRASQTVRIWVVDAQEWQVWAEPTPEVTCLAIVSRYVPSGETVSFGVDWPTAPTLAPDRYWIHGLFMFTLRPGAGTPVRENLPPRALIRY